MKVRLPDHFDADAAVIEAKGWLEGVVIEVDGVEHRPVFCDAVRLSQEVADAVAAQGFFYERTLVVVPAVTREHVERAAAGVWSAKRRAKWPESD